MSTDTMEAKAVSVEHGEVIAKWIVAVMEASEELPEGSDWKRAAQHSESWITALLASEQEAWNAS